MRKHKGIKIAKVKPLFWMISAAVFMAVIIGVFYMGGSDKKERVTKISPAATKEEKTQQTKSNYIGSEHKTYYKNEEKKASQKGSSYFAEMGTIAPIDDTDKKVNLNAYDSNAYDEAKALADKQKADREAQRLKNLERQRKQKIENDKTKQKTKEQPQVNTKNNNENNQNNSIRFTEGFNKYLENELKGDTNKGSLRISFQTVTNPNYYDQIIANNTPKVSLPSLGRITAGNVLYGVTLNTLNSDFKDAPVVAEVAIGKYQDAKIIGRFATNDQWVTGIAIVFNRMIYQDKEFPIEAIAVNADYQPNLYDEIDRHWFLRFTGLIVGAGLGALKGAADQFKGANQQTVIIEGGGQTEVGNKPDAQQVAYGAAGGAASEVSGQLQPIFTELWNRPATVTVEAGHAIGIMFTKTVDLIEK
ncbi:DotG/IcmE/VirB10 family protein [Cysteiniphilum marinum]|uniref:DotG/IcmE/VirB10 family protein n=1 Tax=Cysteiniphilum marinum TaxID=2774191 RepID=UPI00193C66DA|nr:DotG/IcmE/VirB10 family protein [Cysteiniphilum marinum]